MTSVVLEYPYRWLFGFGLSLHLPLCRYPKSHLEGRYLDFGNGHYDIGVVALPLSGEERSQIVQVSKVSAFCLGGSHAFHSTYYTEVSENGDAPNHPKHWTMLVLTHLDPFGPC